MRVLEAETGFGPVAFFGTKLHSGHDYFLQSNCSPESARIICFFDSRGVSAAFASSLVKMFVDLFKKENYLVVCRPLDLTTWATLTNFIKLNTLHSDLLITNVGMVDCTPKKQNLCIDMIEQIEYAFKGCKLDTYRLGHGILSDGQKAPLFSINYPDQYIDYMKQVFESVQLLAIKTPLVNQNIRIDRLRPACFFSQLEKSNQLIDELGFKALDLGWFDKRMTYDAVHWTQEGNEFVFNEVIRTAKVFDGFLSLTKKDSAKYFC